jgi:hypothetical protein
MNSTRLARAGQTVALALTVLGWLALTPGRTQAAPPPPEQLLPADTLAMVTVPDWAGLRAAQSESTLVQLWNDPALKPFREHFLEQWREEVIQPLERELQIQFADYAGMVRGQVTIALIQGTPTDAGPAKPRQVFLLDSGDQQQRLKTQLEDLRRKWTDAGKPLRTETVRGVEFAVVRLSTNEIPNTLRKFLPGKSDVEELRDPNANDTEAEPCELFIGMQDSVLILTDTADAAGKVLTRLTGGALPPLSEVDQFAGDASRLFRHALFYGWVNAQDATELMARAFAREAADDEQFSPDPFAQVKPEKVISATGLGSLRSAAFAYEQSPAGGTLTLYLGAPDETRSGVFKILAGEPRDASPPPFVPADVVQYQRWRLDGKKTYAALEQMLRDISPQMLNGVNFALNTADLAGKEKNPNFSLREQLVDNLGDDLISYVKPPRSQSATDLASPPTLFLIGARDGQQMVSAFRMVLGLLFRGGEPASDRDFLGTTIITFSLPNPAMFNDPTAKPREFNVAVSRGYVALSTDSAILEEFLRSADNPVKPLRQVPGFAEALEVVSAPGNSLLSYENQRETARLRLEALRQSATNEAPDLQPGMTPIQESLGLGLPRNELKGWFDFSLLPPFEKIEQYFHYSLFGGGGSAHGLTLKVYSPVPPVLRERAAQEASQPPAAPATEPAPAPAPSGQ